MVRSNVLPAEQSRPFRHSNLRVEYRDEFETEAAVHFFIGSDKAEITYEKNTLLIDCFSF